MVVRAKSRILGVRGREVLFMGVSLGGDVEEDEEEDGLTHRRLL